MALSDLEVFIKERLAVFDETLDLSPGAPIDAQVIQPILRRAAGPAMPGNARGLTGNRRDMLHHLRLHRKTTKQIRRCRRRGSSMGKKRGIDRDRHRKL
jgi:hypothetical protein